MANAYRPCAAIVTLVAAIACGSPDAGQPSAGNASETAGVSDAAVPARRQNLSVADRADWRAVLQWAETCENDFEVTRATDDAGIEFHAISPGLSLVQVLCAAGAYQPTSTFILLDERSRDPVAGVLTFDTYESPDGMSVQAVKSAELTGEPSVSPDARELTVLSVSRQSRDCGIWTRYAIDERAPRVVEVRARLPCPDQPGPPVAEDPGRPPEGWDTIVPPAPR